MSRNFAERHLWLRSKCLTRIRGSRRPRAHPARSGPSPREALRLRLQRRLPAQLHERLLQRNGSRCLRAVLRSELRLQPGQQVLGGGGSGTLVNWSFLGSGRGKPY